MEVMPNKMVRAGETIFHQGDGAEEGMYYICYGKVLVSHTDDRGQVNLNELGEGESFGEMALINSDVRNATVTAKEDCGFYVISRNGFQEKVKLLEPVMRGAFRTFVIMIRSLLEQRENLAKQTQLLREQAKQQPQAAAACSVAATYTESAPAEEKPEDAQGGRKLQF